MNRYRHGVRRPPSKGPRGAWIATVNPKGVEVSKASIWLLCTLHPDGTQVRARLMMPYVGLGHGMAMLPRDGDELVVVFPEGDQHAPIAMWGMFNGVDLVPEGAAEDVVIVEGRRGESLKMHVRGRVDLVIDEGRDTAVGLDDVRSVGGNDQVTVMGSRSESVAARESVIVGDARYHAVGDDDRLLVGGHRTETVAGNRAAQVFGSDARTVLLSDTLIVLGLASETYTLLKTSTFGLAGWQIGSLGPVSLTATQFTVTIIGGEFTVNGTLRVHGTVYADAFVEA